MSSAARVAILETRAVIGVGGPDWRGFLQGLITQDVETLAPGELRFAALLTPQGRLLYDLFLVGTAEGCLLDCAAQHREALVRRLSLYRLRAKVTITPQDIPVLALWAVASAPEGWRPDPRLAALGFRSYGAAPPADASPWDENGYETHRLSHGVPGPADWGVDQAYPIEADFDLLNGIDFRKGCFVGQETTSRMKRRGAIRSRMVAIAVDGEPPPAGSALMAGALRAGQITSADRDGAMALLRLDRLAEGSLTLPDGRPWRPLWPEWLPPPPPPTA